MQLIWHHMSSDRHFLESEERQAVVSCSGASDVTVNELTFISPRVFIHDDR